MKTAFSLSKSPPWIAALVLALVPALSGCDDSNPVSPEPDPPDSDEAVMAASAYTDTTSIDGQQVIIVREGPEKAGIGITYADGTVQSEVTWSNDYVYLLEGRIFVNEGQTLTIEPGTIIKGAASDDPESASVLIVARGGTIRALGAPENPVIFTAEADDVTDPTDLPPSTRGLWGGVIILGHAKINTPNGVAFIEGIPNAPRAKYGCGQGSFTCDPADDSGVFKYVSIRYGGVSIGANNEINGLTMGAVGSGTEIHHVEVFNNQDDGFEWFGGTVNTHHLVAAFVGDDSFDMDSGHRGTHQFWFAIQPGSDDPVDSGNTAEHDGDGVGSGEALKPLATPHVYNATFIGSGPNGNGNLVLYLRESFAGSYFNSIFTRYPEQAVRIEDVTGTDVNDSRHFFEQGELEIAGNLFYAFYVGDPYDNTFADLVFDYGTGFGEALANYLAANNAFAASAPIMSISRKANGGLNPLPTDRATGDAVAELLVSYDRGDTGFLKPVDYVGAFGSANWAEGWTFLGAAGYF